MTNQRTAWALSAAFALVIAAAYVGHLPRANAATAAAKSDNADAHLARGLQLHQQGAIDLALAEYEQAVALNPQSALAYYDIGVARNQQKRVDEAIAAYRQAVTLDPNMADAHFNLAYALAHDKRELEEALAHFSRAIEINPTFAKAHFERGLIYDALGMTERAQSSYGLAVKLDPAFAAAAAKNATPGPTPR